VTGLALVLLAVVAWLGLTLLLQQLRWFRRVSLVERLRPYAPGFAPGAPRSSLRDDLVRWSSGVANRVASSLDLGDDLERRLTRVHADADVAGFRARQVGAAVLGAALGAATAALLALPPAASVLFLLGGPALGFLLPEHRLTARSERWQRQVLAELPVVAEQLAMLLGAGWSLGSALQRLADRGSGAVSRDLGRVGRRVRNGASEQVALAEWADVARVAAVEQLVRVLVLHHATSDLGRLVGHEAAQIRRDAHRRLVTEVERRNQQVWIPVTVAALVPGVLFLAIPFVDALRAFGA
jgi:tight adherence protein C